MMLVTVEFIHGTKRRTKCRDLRVEIFRKGKKKLLSHMVFGFLESFLFDFGGSRGLGAVSPLFDYGEVNPHHRHPSGCQAG